MIGELQGYERLRQEVRYGEERSRIDLLLERGATADCYIEVKSVTLLGDAARPGWLQPASVSSRIDK